MDPSTDKVRARRLAEHQGGRISYAQLLLVGLSAQIIKGWIANGTLIRTVPKVYALGYLRTDLVALIWEAILYAGPGAYLTGASGAHHCELIAYPPPAVVVATPRKIRSLPGITVLSRRPTERRLRTGVPVAPIPELMLELAAEGTGDVTLVRKALANLDFRRQLDIAALLGVCARGCRGSTTLRTALTRHLPQLAYTNGPLEDAFIILLDARHLPLPRCNVRIHGILVDAYWPELGLVVELDGRGNHGTAAHKRRDDDYMEILRGHGLTTARFTWDDVHIGRAAMLRTLAAAGLRR